jgi:hypothetical protein
MSTRSLSAALAAIILAGCGAGGTWQDYKPPAEPKVKHTSLDAWQACVERVGSKYHALEMCGSGGCREGKVDVFDRDCGKRPTKYQEVADALLPSCYGNRGLTQFGDWQLAQSWLKTYKPTDPEYIKLDAACRAKGIAAEERLEREKAQDRVTEERNRNARMNSSAFGIDRVYSGQTVTKVVVRTPKSGRVKCAAFDASGNAIAVSTNIVTAPIDEVWIGTDGTTRSVHSAKCWQIGR